MKLNDILIERVYHASPFKFDEFSMGNVGTGNGQAFGWGIYFSEKKGDTYDYIWDSDGHDAHVYTVEIDDRAVPRMLDWEAKLSQQPPYVLNVITDNSDVIEQKAHFNTPLEELMDIQTGGSLYKILTTELRGAEAATKYLRSLGITGIKHSPFAKWSESKTLHYTMFTMAPVKIISRDSDPFTDVDKKLGRST